MKTHTRHAGTLLSALLAPMLASPSAHAAPGDAIGPVRELVHPDADRYVSNARLAARPDGELVLSWLDSRGSLCLQTLNADGAAQAAAVCHDEAVYGGAQRFNTVVGRDGVLSVSFVSSASAYVARFDAQLQPLGPPALLHAYRPSRYFGQPSPDTPSVAVDEDGDVTVSLIDAVYTVVPPIPYLGVLYGYSTLYTRSVAADGTVGDERALEVSPGYPGLGETGGIGTALLARPHGGLLMAYSDGAGLAKQVKLRQILSNGLSYAMPGATAISVRMFYAPQVANAPDGGALVLYSPQNLNSRLGELYLRRYSATGFPQTAIKLTEQTQVQNSFGSSDIALAVASDGSVAAAWTGATMTGTMSGPTTVRVTICSADNRVLLAESALPMPADGFSVLSSMVAGSQDDFFVVWQERQPAKGNIMLGHYRFH